jgi:hypothetical protein
MYSLDNLPEGITPKDIAMVERYDRLSKLYAARAQILKDKIKAAFGAGNFALGRVLITSTSKRTLDKDAFIEAHPYSEFPQYYTVSLAVTSIPKAARKGFEVESLSTAINVAD